MDYIYYADVFKAIAWFVGIGFALRIAVPIILEGRAQRAEDARKSQQADRYLDSIEADYKEHFSEKPYKK